MTRPAGPPAGTPPAGTPPTAAEEQRPAATQPPAEPPAAAEPPVAAEPPADHADAAPPTPQVPRTPRQRPPWWLLGVVAAIALAGLVTSLALLLRPSGDELRDSARTAAERYTQSLTSYDARTLDEDVARVKRVSSPTFASEYERTITALRQQISTGQLVSVGTVVGTGLERLQGRTAVVLVAVDQQVTQAGQPPRTEANRVRLTLERANGRWLLAGVERL